MSRPLRIDRAGGWYHVMARGINRQRIFLDDIDRRHWLGLLTELVGRFRTRIHAYALLDNHYHMIIETLEPNLSRAMQWLQTSYSMWHNRRHGRIGPLFQGRFRSVVVEDGSWGYELSVYVHLNPLRLERFRLSRKERKAGQKGLDRPPTAEECRQRLEKLRNYRWSSYRAYAGYEQTPKWLTTREILRRSGGEEKYRQASQDWLSEGTDEGMLERLHDGVALGSEAFRRRVVAIGREKGREIAGRREFNPRVPYEEMIKMAEELTGEKLEANLKRRRSTVKPLVMWASRKACGFTLREIGERLGGMDYNAVSMMLHRWEVNLERSPAAAAIATQLMLMCKV